MKKFLIAAFIVGSITLTQAAHAAVPGNPAPQYGDWDAVVHTGQAISYYAGTAYMYMMAGLGIW